jgi:hypothetical protein
MFGQARAPYSTPAAMPESTGPAALATQTLEENPDPDQSGTAGAASDPKQAATKPQDQDPQPPNPQPKRIPGFMPNFRAVSAGAIPPPPTPKQACVIAAQNSSTMGPEHDPL